MAKGRAVAIVLEAAARPNSPRRSALMQRITLGVMPLKRLWNKIGTSRTFGAGPAPSESEEEWTCCAHQNSLGIVTGNIQAHIRQANPESRDGGNAAIQSPNAAASSSISTGTSATQSCYFGASGDFAEKSRHSVR